MPARTPGRDALGVQLSRNAADTKPILQAFRTFVALRWPDDWKAANATTVQSTSTHVSVDALDVTAEQRRALIKYLAEQLTPKEVPVAPGQAQIASGKATESATEQPVAE